MTISAAFEKQKELPAGMHHLPVFWFPDLPGRFSMGGQSTQGGSELPSSRAQVTTTPTVDQVYASDSEADSGHVMTDLTELEILASLSYSLVDRLRHMSGLTGFDAHPHTQISFKKYDYKLHPELRDFSRIIKPYNAL